MRPINCVISSGSKIWSNIQYFLNCLFQKEVWLVLLEQNLYIVLVHTDVTLWCKPKHKVSDLSFWETFICFMSETVNCSIIEESPANASIHAFNYFLPSPPPILASRQSLNWTDFQKSFWDNSSVLALVGTVPVHKGQSYHTLHFFPVSNYKANIDTETKL